MAAEPNDIVAPAAKAGAAIVSSAGATAVSMAQNAQSFFPTDAAGWMAFFASSIAVLLSLHYLGEWYWKKIWRPFGERKGWLKPLKRKVVMYVDQDEVPSE